MAQSVLMENKVGEGTLPQDHEDQLQLGVRIIQSAHSNKVHQLEQEIRGLRLTCEEQRANVAALQKKNSSLEVELVESHQRSQQLAEENKELFKTVGSLRKQISRLENLKAAVMTSIQDDAEKEAELGDTKALMSEQYLSSATPLTANYSTQGMRALTAQQQMPPPRGPYEQTATGYGTSPTPTAGLGGGGPGSPVIDGKAFFRQARGKLSYEAFNQFLQSIKRLNNQQQTREATLEEAKGIFGPQLQDLYMDFEGLLNRQGM